MGKHETYSPQTHSTSTSNSLSLAHPTPNLAAQLHPRVTGLRGLAVLAVVLYHCHPRLEGTPVHYASLWGWAGVNLFFVLSGFLITSILLEAREQATLLSQLLCAQSPAHLAGLRAAAGRGLPERAVVHRADDYTAIKTAPWLAYIFLVQNLFHLTLPPAIGPTWSLAIEEQYYFLWAPLVRFLRRPWMLAIVLCRRAHRLACVSRCKPGLDDKDPHAHSPGRHRARQPAGTRASYTRARTAHLAMDRLASMVLGYCGHSHHRRWHGVPRLRVGAGICRRSVGRDCIDWRTQSAQCRCSGAGRSPSMAASATALYMIHIIGLHLFWLV